METQKPSFFNEVYAVKIDSTSYKIIIPCDLHISPESMKNLAQDKAAEELTDYLLYTIGWWQGTFARNVMKFKKVEIILPSIMEYVPLGERLRNELSVEGIEIEINIGIKVDVPENDLKEKAARDFVNETLARFSQRSFTNN